LFSSCVLYTFFFIKFIFYFRCSFFLNLGFTLLHITTNNQLINWWKNELILWKSNSIEMKIFNDLVCNLNWIEFKFNSIPIKLISISIQLNLIQQLNFNSIEKMACKLVEKVLKFNHDYGVGKKIKFKYTFPCFFTWK